MPRYRANLVVLRIVLVLSETKGNFHQGLPISYQEYTRYERYQLHRFDPKDPDGSERSTRLISPPQQERDPLRILYWPNYYA
jgi:hypothetical protein